MKCLLITNYFPPTIGGSSSVYYNLVKYSNGNISVLTSRYNQNTRKLINRSNFNSNTLFTVKYLQSPNIRCNSVFDSLWSLLRYDIPTQAFTLIKTLSLVYRYKFNIICVGELQIQGWLTIAMKLLTSAKVILYAHGEELTTTTSSRFMGKNAKLYLSKADGIVAVSNFTKNIISNQYGICEDKIQLIANGIDLDRLHVPSIPDPIIEQYIKPNRILIFAVSRLIERKGFDKAIEAIRIVKDAGYDIHYVIAGSGEMENRLNRIINSLDLASTVTLIGSLTHTQLVTFLSGCDIFLMPNRELDNGDTEGFGLVFLEANAFSKPVIGGMYGGAVDAIIDGDTGFLVDSKSANEIANALIKLLDNPELRSWMGQKGYLWAMNNDARNKAELFLQYCETIHNS